MARGFSIHIGINQVDPIHYAGWDGYLSKCENDAHFMESIAKVHGFANRQLILTNDATSENIIQSIQDISEKAEPNDLFLLSYSGHGESITDISGDEDDWVDETWCLFDRQLVDDELNNLFAKFKRGVRILAISDSCHSGTVTKNHYIKRWSEHNFPEDAKLIKKKMPNFVADFIYQKNQTAYDQINQQLEKPNLPLDEVDASVILLAGCQDNQSSYILESESIKYSVFTQGMYRIFSRGLKFKNYKDFYYAIVKELQGFEQQRPNYLFTGAKDKEFEGQQPFVL